MGFLLTDANELAVVDPEFIFLFNPFRMQKRILICSSFAIRTRWENCLYFRFSNRFDSQSSFRARRSNSALEEK